MKKLIGALGLVVILCGLAGQAKAESTLTPWLELSDSYHVYYGDENIYIEFISEPGPGSAFRAIEILQEGAAGTFYNEFASLNLVIKYDAESRYPGSEYVFINILNELSYVPAISGYYNADGVFFDTWEMSLKNNYDILVPYIDVDPEGSGYDVVYYPETIGIEATLSMNDQGYLSIWFSVSEPFSSPSPVPIPPAALLLGSGLGGLAALRRKIK